MGEKTPASQKYIVHRLMEIGSKNEFKDDSEIINQLIQAFRLPLLRDQTRELSKLKKNDQVESDDSLLFNVLVKMYNNYGLSALVKKTEDEVDRSDNEKLSH